jgi:folate-binding protein YgfZ
VLSVDEAYELALNSGVRVERPSGLRLLKLTGPQRVWFLQNTVTADVEDIGEGKWVESCFLDPKGRIQAHFRVGFLAEEVWLDVEPDATEALAEWFVRYRFRTKVDIDTVTKPCVTVLGPAARSHAAPGRIVSAGGLTFGYTIGDVPAVDIHSDAPSIDLPEAPEALYDVLRIEAGIGAFGVDYDTRTLPQEAGLTRVVSVEKGCYVGQETVARLHFRGHVNKVLRRLRFEGGEPPPGAELGWEGSPVGQVTSVARSPREGWIGIGMIRVEPPEGARLHMDNGTAELGPLPEGTKVKTPG